MTSHLTPPQFPIPPSFFFSSYGDHRDLHSFPTRRSSDLGSTTACSSRRSPASTSSMRWSPGTARDRKSTRLNPSHGSNSYAVFCLKKKKNKKKKNRNRKIKTNNSQHNRTTNNK